LHSVAERTGQAELEPAATVGWGGGRE